ncbi:MAG TPA: hypothetical protein VEB22_15190 [Phycisphaerales bacterium]|nr:hypothetical protein [Phycisphaerales bacterium]
MKSSSLGIAATSLPRPELSPVSGRHEHDTSEADNNCPPIRTGAKEAAFAALVVGMLAEGEIGIAQADKLAALLEERGFVAQAQTIRDAQPTAIARQVLR